MSDTKAFEEVKSLGLVPEGAILVGYRGSLAHGTWLDPERPDAVDDRDLMGVVVPPLGCYFGTENWASHGTKEIVRDPWDCVYYELSKMAGLLAAGNPNVQSLLWLKPEHYLRITAAGWLLLDMREMFLSKKIYGAFAGYASGQLQKMTSRDPAELRMYLALTAEAKHRGIHPNHKGERLGYPADYDQLSGEARVANTTHDDKLLQMLASYQKKGENIGYLGDKRKKLVLEHGYDTKNASHCIRLLRMGIELLSSGKLAVFREDARELVDIKLGKWTLERVQAEAEDLFEEARIAADKSPLPEKPDWCRISQSIVEIVALEHHLSVAEAAERAKSLVELKIPY